MWLVFGLLLVFGNVWGQTYFYEAEDLEIVDGPVVMAEDTVMIFYSWGTIQIPNLNLTGNCEITVFAREDFAGDDHVRMRIATPSFTDTVLVDSGEWQEYDVIGEVESSGNWRFSFINDYSGRRMYMDWIRIRKVDFEGTVFLSWNPNSEADLAGYRTFRGKESQSYNVMKDVGNVTADTLENLADGRYYFSVTAYDTAANESEFSEEVSAVISSIEELIGDYNGDGRVDIEDMIEFDKSFGSTIDGSDYNAYFDFNSDGRINFEDMIVFDSHFGDSVIILPCQGYKPWQGDIEFKKELQDETYDYYF